MAKKQQKAAAREGVVVDAPTEEQQLVSTDTDKLRAFMGGMAKFFGAASALETQARSQLTIAKALKPPTNSDEDAKVQVVIRDAKRTRRAIDEHWGIAQIVHGLHRRLTAARERAGTQADDAADIAQRLHNTYVEDARRKAREEEDRINREREEAARLERERQLDEMERDALVLEANVATLSEREELFVSGVVAGLGAIDAARRAGYRDPVSQGPRLMDTKKVIAAIEARRAAASVRRQAAAIASKPIEVERATVAADVTKTAGTGGDTVRWSGEVLDERLFIEAVIGGKHGIPADVLMINPTKLNDYAVSMHELIDRWPGVRAKKTTTTRVTR